MRENLRKYIDTIFMDAPTNIKTIELKEEMLQNLYDKYDDLISEGKSGEAAYNIAVASVGDISGLLAELKSYVPGSAPKISDEEYQKRRQKSGILTGLAIALYILCPVCIIITQNLFGVVMMFVFIAAATFLLIYNGMTKSSYPMEDETVVEEFRAWKQQTSESQKLRQSVNSAIWTIIVAVYLVVSFSTGAWHVSWVIFLIGSAISGVVKAVFDYKEASR